MSGIDNSYKMDGDVLLVISLFRPSTAADSLTAGRELERKSLRNCVCVGVHSKLFVAVSPQFPSPGEEPLLHALVRVELHHIQSRHDPIYKEKFQHRLIVNFYIDVETFESLRHTFMTKRKILRK